MNYSIIVYILGHVIRLEGLLLLIPTLVGICYSEQQYLAFLICAVICVLIGCFLTLKKPKNQVFYAREGFVTVAFSWFVLSFFGCLPFVISKDIPHFADAFFETASGFTTTGSSILENVEVLAHCSLFWRSFTHWIGGMGILVFVLTVLPLAGGATMHLMRAESPGPQVGKMVPRVRDTSIILYAIYSAMTVIQIILLLCGGMPLFDAVTLSFGTAGTGGFAVRNSGLAGYSAYSQYIIAIFMILFGVNFNVYFLAIRKNFKQALNVEESHWYLGAIAIATLFITFNTRSLFITLEQSFRSALFQVASVITTTGYSTADFNLFPSVSKLLLLLLMFSGACAGSTGGGIKVSRLVILAKSLRGELSRILHPRAVNQIRFEHKKVDDSTVRSIYTFMVAYTVLFCCALIIISFDNFDMTTNFTSVLATINNIGPGLEMVGPTGNFSKFSDLSKYIFSFCMIAGRLEIFPVLVMLNPRTWKSFHKIKVAK